MLLTRQEVGLCATLLLNRARMLFNGAFRDTRERRGWAVFVVLFVLGGMVLAFRFAQRILGFGGAVPADLGTPVAGLLTLLGGFVAATSITFALSSLYFARDLDLLHTAPMRARLIVLSRLYSQLGLGLGMGCVLAGPPLFAFLIAVHQVAVLPLVAVLVMGSITAPLALGTAIVVAALRLVPARFARDAGGFVVTLAFFLIAAVNLVLRGPSGITSEPSALPLTSLGTSPLAGAWSPVGWASRGVVAAVHGDIGTAALWTLPVLLTLLVLPPLCAVAVERAYVIGFQRNAVAGIGRSRTRERGRSATPQRGNPAVWRVILAKDLRQIRRDPSQLGQLALPLVLFALYLGSPGHAGLSASALPWWYLLSLNAAFASLLFATNIALRGVGSEGPRMWLLRLPPVRSRAILGAKYAAGFTVAAIPGTILLWVGAARAGHTGTDLLGPTVRLVVMIAGVVAIAVGLGALRPRLDWTDPRRAVGIGTTIVYLVGGALYLTTAYILMGLPYALRIDPWFGDAGLLLLTGVIAALALGPAAIRLRRLEI